MSLKVVFFAQWNARTYVSIKLALSFPSYCDHVSFRVAHSLRYLCQNDRVDSECGVLPTFLLPLHTMFSKEAMSK